MFYDSFYIRLTEGKSLSRVIEATLWLPLVGEGVTGRGMGGNVWCWHCSLVLSGASFGCYTSACTYVHPVVTRYVQFTK